MRLIDGDALFDEAFKAWGVEADGGETNLFMEMIHNAPTIALPPNDPLTISELREMDGEPVWCEKFGWRICYMVSDFRGYPCMEIGAGGCIRLDDYGLEWRAYRRKPEEGTK